MRLLKLVAFSILALEAKAAIHSQPPEPTETLQLQKRYKNKIIGKEYAKLQAQRTADVESTTTDAPKPWVRTIYSDKVEIVRPTVIAGVTFSARPPETTNGLEPWINLNKDGSPKTIKPQYKNGQFKKASPTYGTWFAAVTTVAMGKEELKAHNMADDEIFEHEKVIPEDQTYQMLNPLVRCTPDRYSNKGLGKDVSSEPFCTPQDNQNLKMDKTYFITWYSRFFKNAKKVKIHLSFLKEHAAHKGTKRSLENEGSIEEANITKRSSLIEQGATLKEKSFFQSDWLDVEQGYYPVTIDEEWFGKEWYKKVLLSIQPEDTDIEDFDYLKNSIVIEISKGAKVSKEHLTDYKKLEEKWRKQELNVAIEEGPDFEKYIIMMSVPTCVAIFALGMYLFVMYNNKNLDLSHLRRKKAAGKKTLHRRIPFKKKKNTYSELPQYKSEVETKAD